MLRVGSRGVLHDLQTKPELNGREVEVLAWVADRGRWRTSNPLGGGTINVRPENLAAARGAKRTRQSSAGTSRSFAGPPQETLSADEAPRSRRSGKTTHQPMPQQDREQLEQILTRPESYVGAMQRQSHELWVLAEDSHMALRRLEFVPALYRLFDELLLAAAGTRTASTIRVGIDRERCTITVWHNGRGIPVEARGGRYVPELAYGHLSDNRISFGLKLANAFSRSFSVELVDAVRRRRFLQRWHTNMSEHEPPELLSVADGEEDSTCVTFEPDLARFGMLGLEDDVMALMQRRVYDVAASRRGQCLVYLDGKKVPLRSFQDYMGLYLRPGAFCCCELCNERWEVGVALSDGAGFQHVSLVNCISTPRGGTHVTYVADQLVPALLGQLTRQKGWATVKPQHVRSHLWLFVNCFVDGPTFDSQLRDALVSRHEHFGSTCTLSPALLKAVLTNGLAEAVASWSREPSRHRGELGLSRRLLGIPELEDAHKAGTKQAQDCTLIVTKSGAATAVAVAGLGVAGREFYGVLPLGEEFRSARELTLRQAMENREIRRFVQALALDGSKRYTDVRGLRYGSLCIMADRNAEGSLFKGLVVSTIQQWFPGLLQVPGFLKQLVVPVARAVRDGEVRSFFASSELESWMSNGDGWQCRHYSGLGSSTAEEAREYFADPGRHQVAFEHSGTTEEEELFDMAFSGRRAGEWRRWVLHCEDTMEPPRLATSFCDLVGKELALHAKHELQREVPCLVDGLDSTQRKVLHSAFLRKLHADTKVEHLSSYVLRRGGHVAREAAVQWTIVRMAQDFVGSNNINLLLPLGQFGTRSQGGHDHAEAQYIYTRLSLVARYLFVQHDDMVLSYLSDEGAAMEPRWYCPVIPLVLVNGPDCICAGGRTSVPSYRPHDVIANVRRHLRGEQLEPMLPWYRGFKGKIRPMQGEQRGVYETVGVAEKHGQLVDITELPLRRWTQDYKDWLLEQERGKISAFREQHTEDGVHFSLALTPEQLAAASAEGFESAFQLKSRISTNEMFLLDALGRLRKYETPEEILREFVAVRLEAYRKRKEHLTARLEREVALLNDKARFVRLVVEGHLDLGQRNPLETCLVLRRHGLRTRREISAGEVKVKAFGSRLLSRTRVVLPADDAGIAELLGPRGYGYLLSMKIWALTEEHHAELDRRFQEKLRALTELRSTSPEHLWERDLASLEQALEMREEEADPAQPHRPQLQESPKEETPLANGQYVLVLNRMLGELKRVPAEFWRAKHQSTRQVRKRRRRKKSAEVPEEFEVVESSEMGEEDGVSDALTCREEDALLIFTEHGYVHACHALDVPLQVQNAPGAFISDLLPNVSDNHRITAVIIVRQGSLKNQEDEFAVIVTAFGVAKRVALSSFRTLRHGKPSCTVQLERGDEVRWVHRASAADVLIIATALGFVTCFPLSAGLPSSALRGRGKPALRVFEYDQVVASSIARHPDPSVAELKSRSSVLTAYQFFARERGCSVTQAIHHWHYLSAEEQQRFKVQAAQCRRQRQESRDVEHRLVEVGSMGTCDSEDADEEFSNSEEEPPGRVEQLARRTASMGPFAELCLLVLTRMGEGKRVRLGDLGFRRRNQVGRRCIRLQYGDAVAAVCVVPADELPALPRRPRPPELIYHQQQQQRVEHQRRQLEFERQEEESAAEPDEELAGDNVDFLAGAIGRALEGAALSILAAPRDPAQAFSMLKDAERAPFLESAAREREAYRVALEARKLREPEVRERLGRVLVCMAGGSLARVQVACVEVRKQLASGRPLIKVPPNDEVCTACMLPVLDEESAVYVPSGDCLPLQNLEG